MSGENRYLPIIWVALGGLLCLAGAVLVLDRSGLSTEYFAISPTWDGRPVFRAVSSPQLESRQEVASVLVSQEMFSLRWKGWIWVESSGIYRFSLSADEHAYLRLDDTDEMQTLAARGKRRRTARHELDRGFHAVEIGLSQTGGRSSMQVSWSEQGEVWRPLAGDALFSRSPRGLSRRARVLLSHLTRVQRQMLGVLLLALGLAIVLPWILGLAGRLQFRGVFARPRIGYRSLDRILFVSFLMGLMVVTWLACFPLTTSTVDGDDLRYMSAALFGHKMGWIFNRYVHVYALKASMWLQGGDAFLGARSYWCVMFGLTLAGLAVAVRSVGPRWQVRTLAVTVFIVLSQSAILIEMGAAFADYTAMMFITLAVAAYLHGLSSANGKKWPWQCLLTGALTLAAVKSKETGLVLVWLPVLYLWSDSRLDWARWARRMGLWLAGAASAYVLLMMLDAWLIGDFWFSLRPRTIKEFLGLKAAANLKSDWGPLVWWSLVWSGHPRPQPFSFALRNLSLLVLAGFVVANVTKQRLEIRLLHLMPIVFVVMMTVLHPPFFMTRFVIPILPVACFLSGLTFHYLGVDTLDWRSLLARRWVISICFLVGLLTLFVVPLRISELVASDLHLPAAFVDWIRGYGVILLLALSAVLALRRRLQLAPMVFLVVVLFGAEFHFVQSTLSKQSTKQGGDLLLYPWSTFESELKESRPKKILVTHQLRNRYGMVGKRLTRDRLARLVLRRPRLQVELGDTLDRKSRAAIGTQNDLANWSSQQAGVASTAVVDPTGKLVLVRPGVQQP